MELKPFAYIENQTTSLTSPHVADKDQTVPKEMTAEGMVSKSNDTASSNEIRVPLTPDGSSMILGELTNVGDRISTSHEDIISGEFILIGVLFSSIFGISISVICSK